MSLKVLFIFYIPAGTWTMDHTPDITTLNRSAHKPLRSYGQKNNIIIHPQN